MILTIKQLRKLISENLSEREEIRDIVYGRETFPVDVEWNTYEEDLLRHLPERVFVPFNLVLGLFENPGDASIAAISQFIMRSVFRDQWSDPRRAIPVYSWDFSKGTGLGVNSGEIVLIDEKIY